MFAWFLAELAGGGKSAAAVPAKERIRFPGGGRSPSRVEDRPLCDISAAGSTPFAHVPAASGKLDLSSEKTIINACS